LIILARRRRRGILVPEAQEALNNFKGEVMADKGFTIGLKDPNQVKFEVADELGIPLDTEYNGDLKTKNAGKIGGQIGGKMVHDMIRIAQEQMAKKF
jgi:small acid-soluble spore protein D (minor alpha/beta-type SASP)